MPTGELKPTTGWHLDETDGQGQQLSHYYNAATQYNQQYNFYNPSALYRHPYLPTTPGAIYGQTYPNGFDCNGYPAAMSYGVQYYNRSMGAVGTSPISSTSFQQYTNNLINTGNYNSTLTPTLNNTTLKSASPSPSSNYYNCTTPKTEVRPKKSKRRKATNVHGKQEVVYKRVYIWELDELYADSSHFISEPAMQSLIGQIVTDRFQLTSTEEFDYTNIEDANIDETLAEQQMTAFNSSNSSGTNETFGSTSGLEEKSNELQQPLISTTINAANSLDNIRRNAASQQRIKDVYLNNQFDFSGFIKNLDPTLFHVIEQQRVPHRLQPYGRCIRLITEKSAASTDSQQANVVLSQEPLPFAFAKLLIQGVAAYVQPENVYSATRSEASNALERIVARFKREKLLVISGRTETIQAAKNLNIPVWQVHQPRDVDTLHTALERYLC